MPKLKRVLAADDRLGIQRMISEALLPYGYQVEAAENGLDAIKKIESSVFDLILLDKKMPKLVGIKAFSLIKESKPDLPIIIMSAGDELELMEEAPGSYKSGPTFFCSR